MTFLHAVGQFSDQLIIVPVDEIRWSERWPECDGQTAEAGVAGMSRPTLVSTIKSDRLQSR
jgi:hypothetical protein